MGLIRLIRSHPSNPGEFLLNLFGRGAKTISGTIVTPETALQNTTVLACVQILSESVAGLPLILYRRQGRGKVRATDTPVYNLLHILPNPEMTAFELREILMAHLLLRGNAYCEIEWTNGGQVKALWPLHPDKMKVYRKGGQKIYEYTLPSGRTEPIPSMYIWHIKGFGGDLAGVSIIQLAREAIGQAIATDEFGARFFSNGAKPGLVFEYPGKLGDKAFDRLRQSLEGQFMGLDNAHRIAILEEGLSAKAIGVAPEDAQLMEARKFSAEEIAGRIFRVPLHMVGLLDHATFSNIEHQGIQFVVNTLRAWLVRIEQSAYRDLLTPRQQQDLFFEHLIDALLRGDIMTRYQAYSIGRNWGWLSANDVLEMENRNPIEGGDAYLIPLNMVPADQIEAQNSQNAGENDAQNEQNARNLAAESREIRAKNLAQKRRDLGLRYRKTVERAVKPLINDEIKAVRAAMSRFLGQRDAQDLYNWLAGFYSDQRQLFIEALLPIMTRLADQVGVLIGQELDTDDLTADTVSDFISEFVNALATRLSNEGQFQLQAVITEALEAGEDPGEAVEERLQGWETNRAETIGREEGSRGAGAIAKAFYIAAGITRIKWVAFGDTCPYCRDLDGKVVGIKANFLNKETNFEPDGAERPLNVRSNIGHPPVHDGCDCAIIAAG